MVAPPGIGGRVHQRAGDRLRQNGASLSFHRALQDDASDPNRAICVRCESGVRVWIVVSGARLILTCGLPGAGKTTLARQLAADRGAVRLTKDEWLWALGSSPWDAPTQEKVERELWRIAQDILALA